MNHKSTITLFNSLRITNKVSIEPSKDLLKNTLKYGVIFTPEVCANYNDEKLINIAKTYGISARQMNSSFHKSWGKVKNASDEQLILEQIIHYITTYGFETLSIYDKNSVYIPAEKLDIPDLDLEGGCTLKVIKGYTNDELREKCFGILGSGVALKNDTQEAIIDILDNVGFCIDDIDNVKNKEFKMILYKELDIIPKAPIEFLRYAVYLATGKPLLIKSPSTIHMVKMVSANKKEIHNLFHAYTRNRGMEGLASLFYRFKPLFLAFKNNETKSYINKIRKLADKYHKPMKEDYINNVVAKITNDTINKKEFIQKLSEVNTFRKIKLLYALNYHINSSCNSIVYRIRNDKVWATEKKNNIDTKQDTLVEYYNITLKSIANDVDINVNGKNIYLPDNISYTLPATEKQFTGPLPNGSYVSIPKDIVFGVHWRNVKNHRVDLDLSLLNIDGKIGWDSHYRTDDRSILFSGDMTDAPGKKGASEMFYVKTQKENIYLINLCHYNKHGTKINPKYKFYVGEEKCNNVLEQNFMIDPNNVKFVLESVIDNKQKFIGLLVTSEDENRIYFTESNVCKSNTSRNNDVTIHIRNYLSDFYKNIITLKDILKLTNCHIVDNKEDADIDLSVENLEKDSILNLLK